MAADGEQFAVKDLAGQDVLVSWHPAQFPPPGQRHGSAGICVTPTGDVVLISARVGWDLPAGRPEGDEDWRETLDREMLEEACARVESARLLGFVRGECVKGHEAGLVLVRSVWRADVTLDPWEPQFEVNERLTLRAEDVLRTLAPSPGWEPILRRQLQEAGLAPNS